MCPAARRSATARRVLARIAPSQSGWNRVVTRDLRRRRPEHSGVGWPAGGRGVRGFILDREGVRFGLVRSDSVPRPGRWIPAAPSSLPDSWISEKAVARFSVYDYAVKNEALILALAPGTERCGIARVAVDGAIVWRRVVPRGQLERALNELNAQPPQVVVVSAGARSRDVRSLLVRVFGAEKVNSVEDSDLLPEARRLYFVDHPPSGLWKYLPRSLISPADSIDAYLAVILARRWLEQSGRKA